MDIYGNPSTFNVESVLKANILESDYYRDIFARLKTFNEAVDEIYNQVEHVEPWMSGNCRGPSTAFCILYRMFTMRLNEGQIRTLLDHGDSPFIRATGFLYLRYVCDPKKLWGWYKPYMQDPEEIQPSPHARSTTIGVYARDLLLDQYYFETLFPRIPVLVVREITTTLESLGLPTKALGGGGTGAASRRGTEEPIRRPPSVKAALSVSMGQRAPHRSNAVEPTPERRAEMMRKTTPPLPRPSPNRDRRREDRDDRDGRRDNDRSSSYRDRERERSRHRSRSRSPYRDRRR
eukprot:jgi/Chlat1/2057/Chrsp17S02528